MCVCEGVRGVCVCVSEVLTTHEAMKHELRS